MSTNERKLKGRLSHVEMEKLQLLCVLERNLTAGGKWI